MQIKKFLEDIQPREDEAFKFKETVAVFLEKAKSDFPKEKWIDSSIKKLRSIRSDFGFYDWQKVCDFLEAIPAKSRFASQSEKLLQKVDDLELQIRHVEH